MAGPGGRSLTALTTAPLLERLRREPFRFEGGQALRILSALDGPGVRLRSTFDLAFPTADVEAVSFSSGRPEMIVTSIGLGGAIGPLPVPYTEFINDSAARDEFAPRDFVDIFNGRLVASALALDRLFQPVLQAGPPQDSNLAAQLYAMLGLGTPGVAAGIPQLAPALLPLAALVNQRPLSAHAVERAVASQFGIPTQVRPFQGAWLEIPTSQRTQIGATGRNRRLGVDAVVGRRAWDQSAGIELVLGPIPYVTAERLLPGAADHRRLAALLGFLLGDDIAVTARLIVKGDTAPRTRLAGRRNGPQSPPGGETTGSRLGWTAWLRSGRPRLGRTRLGGGPRLGRRQATETRFAVLPPRPDGTP